MKLKHLHLTTLVSVLAVAIVPTLVTHAAPVAQKIIVIRAISDDQKASITPRYTHAQVQNLFDNELNMLWQNISYGNISIAATVVSQSTGAPVVLPKNRDDYLAKDTMGRPLGYLDISLIMKDAVAKATNVDYSGAKAVMVLLATNLILRGVQFPVMLPIGPSGSDISVPSAAFSENPTQPDLNVWGIWAHEIGHAFQVGSGPPHPSNYNSLFELMDALYPGQSGVVEKHISGGFPGWMPPEKYAVIPIPPAEGPCGDTVFIAAEELVPRSIVEHQAVKVQLSDSLYYMVSVRRRFNGDELFPIPDEGVLIERVKIGGDSTLNDCPDPMNPAQNCPRWVDVKGNGGDRNKLWKHGDTFSAPENVFIDIDATADANIFRINVTCRTLGQPDVFVTPWLTPPLNAYETSDIWIDSSCNGYGTYQYGTYTPTGDATPVGRGNGDNPCANHENRVYARIRNIGTQAANNVVVHFDVTNPLGVGLAGALGWSTIGTVTQADFPGLSSIPANGFTDVFVNWTPSITGSLQGNIDFHSCIRVRVDPVTSELNNANNTAQENVEQFYTPPSPGAAGAPITRAIRLFNDSATDTKTFRLNWVSDLPSTWTLKVNARQVDPNRPIGVSQTEIVLPPGGFRELPVEIAPSGARTTGQIHRIDVTAHSERLLVNSLDPTDTHPEGYLVGGATFEVRIADSSSIQAQAERVLLAIKDVNVSGQLSPASRGRPIMIDLVNSEGQILQSQLVFTNNAGNFTALFAGNSITDRAVVASASFTGEEFLAGSSSQTVIRDVPPIP